MSEERLPEPTESTFESIKRTNSRGIEYWSSRDLGRVLGYGDYRNFEDVIQKAKQACFNSGDRVEDHFVEGTEMIEVGKGARRALPTTYMRRHACYLVILEADSSKPIVAIGKAYFAIQTRRQELADEMAGDQLRVTLRDELRKHNKQLASTAKGAGVVEPFEYAVFQDHGYKGLYGGLGAKDIHTKKGLQKSQQILDHMGSTELAANLFRATQTEEQIRKQGIKGRDAANRTHLEVGKTVRKTIEDIGGTMPEDLPTEPDVKVIERKQKKALEGG